MPIVFTFGQVLPIPSTEKPNLWSAQRKLNRKKSSSKSKSKTRTVTHTIKKGNLNLIAKSGVSVNDIKRWNKITNANKIYADKKTQNPYQQNHMGNLYQNQGTTSVIAQKYGVSVSDIKKWNNLKSTKIYGTETQDRAVGHAFL